MHQRLFSLRAAVNPRLRALCAAVAGLVFAGAAFAADDLAIVGANVVPMTAAGRVLPDQTVLVRDGVITAVGPRTQTTIPAGAKVVDASGMFLAPGLADFHVHSGERSLGLFVANGVTTVRDLSGSDDHLKWRQEIAAGTRLGPRLVVFSPLLSNAPQQTFYKLVPDVAEARRLVQEFAKAGYDGLKIYDGLAADVYAALVDEAQRQKLPITGHIPRSVGLSGVLSAGQALEHAEKTVIMACGHNLDPTKLAAAVDAVIRAKVWLTPTLAVQEVLCVQRTDAYGEFLARPEMAWASASTMTWWNSMRGSGPVDPASFGSRFLALQRQFVRDVGHGGTRILAGTDTPNPGMVPGFSLVDELLALTGAGLTSYEALAAATTAPGEYLGESGKSGVIAPGARADLVLVRGNPLDDLQNLRAPAGVVLAGRWLDRAALDGLLEAARPKPVAK